jgi:hypothetical protein
VGLGGTLRAVQKNVDLFTGLGFGILLGPEKTPEGHVVLLGGVFSGCFRPWPSNASF